MLISNGDQVLTKNVYGSDETLLWEGVINGNDTTVVLSEPLSNFEEFKLYTTFESVEAAQGPNVHQFAYDDNSSSIDSDWQYLAAIVDYTYKPWENDVINVGYATYLISKTDKTLIKCHTGKYNTNMTNKNNRNLIFLYKVVGINRKENA